jgi:hypothetical protein
VSCIGYGIFRYGKRDSRVAHLVAGLALMGFPYFVADSGWMVGIAGGILGGLWVAVRSGL